MGASLFVLFVVASCSVALLPHPASCGDPVKNMTSENLTEIFDRLMSKYDKRFRPNMHSHGTMPVLVGLYVFSVQSIIEVNMEVTMDVYFRQFWRDERLAHGIGNETLNVDPSMLSKMWVPDTYFSNGKKTIKHNVIVDNSFLRISSKGDIFYSTRLTITFSCAMNLKEFPFDTQHCSINMESYSNTADTMLLQWNGDNPVVISKDISMAQFSLTGVKPIAFNLTYSTAGVYSNLKALFTFERSADYFLVQTYLPTMLITALSWISFWIPHKAVPARVALGVTSLLTVTTMFVNVQRSLPRVSYIKAIDWFLLISFVFVFGVIVQYAIVLQLEKIKEAKKKALMNQLQNNKTDDIQNGETVVENGHVEDGHVVEETLPEPVTKTGREKPSNLYNNILPLQVLRKHVVKEETKAGHEAMANDANAKQEDSYDNILDKICRILFPVLYALFIFLYILYTTGF